MLIREEGEKRKEKGERGDGAKEEDEITAGELLWLSALRAQRLKVNLGILHSLLIGRHFFFLGPAASPPPPTHPTPSHQTLACVLFRTGIKASTLNLLSGFVEIRLQVVEGASKASAQKVPVCWSLVWSFESELGDGDTLHLQILSGLIVVYVVQLAAQSFS